MQHSIHIAASGGITNSGRNLPAFQLTFSYNDRHVAQKVCQELVSRFVNENTRNRYEDAVATHQFMNDEFEKAKRELDALEQKLGEFRSKNAGHLPEQMKAMENSLANLNQSQSRVSQEKMMLESSLAIAKDRLASIRENNPDVQARSEKIDQFDKQITALEASIASMQERYTDPYPDLEAD